MSERRSTTVQYRERSAAVVHSTKLISESGGKLTIPSGRFARSTVVIARGPVGLSFCCYQLAAV